MMSRREKSGMDKEKTEAYMKENQNDGGTAQQEKLEGARQDCSSTVLVLYNVSRNLTRKHVQEIFSAYGTVKGVYFPRDDENQLQKSYAFVEYDSRDDAERASMYMGGGQIDGLVVRTEILNPPAETTSVDQNSNTQIQPNSSTLPLVQKKKSRSRSRSRKRSHSHNRNRRAHNVYYTHKEKKRSRSRSRSRKRSERDRKYYKDKSKDKERGNSNPKNYSRSGSELKSRSNSSRREESSQKKSRSSS